MAMRLRLPVPAWSVGAPAAAWLFLAGESLHLGGGYAFVLGAGLVGAVLAAVHHAEVIAHRIGEPLGTLVLALAVTVIEAGLIVSLMLVGGDRAAALVRDTVFAAVMIILNGIVGLCLLLGGGLHHEQEFRQHGVSASLAALGAIAVLSLVLPNYTLTTPGPFYSAGQLAFVAAVSVILYGTLLLVQVVRHRDYFLPATPDAEAHAPPPAAAVAALSAALLLACLGAVVMLGEALAGPIEHAVAAAGAPPALVGVIVAGMVLLPEGTAAVRAALANRLQTSLNLALGSALASIGLTIPAVAGVSLLIGLKLELGLDPKSTVLLVLSLFVACLSLGTGRTTVLQGAVHLVIFAVYLFTSVVP